MGSNILIILISLIVIAVVAFIVFKTTKKKFEFKGESEFNSMLTEILAESFSTNPLPNVTQKIVRILKRYYKVEYVTVLILNNSNRLKVISSNIQGEYFKRVEQYCNEQLRSMEESIVKLHTD